ncbi:MAG: alpha-L-arabinofuranosidase C-terminal domain-containing protein [Prevotella sp.]
MNRLFITILACTALTATVHAQNIQPSYGIYGNDTTVQVFLYSPNPKAGLHIAYLSDEEQWTDVGQLCSSEYGPSQTEQRMYNPFVINENGTYRLLFGVGDNAPCLGVAYSEDLVTWRPQDFPKMSVRGCKEPIAFVNNDNGFDIYFRTKEGPRFLTATNDFRHFSKDEPSTIEDVAWLRDTATISGKIFEGSFFELPKVHFDYIVNYLNALAQDAQMSALSMSDDARRFASLPNVTATMKVDMNRQKTISNRLFGVFFEDINYAADGGLYAELVQNRDFEYSAKDHKGWNAATGWNTVAPNGKLNIATDFPLSKNNPHYVILSEDGIYNRGFDGITLKADSLYDFCVQARLMDSTEKKKKVVVMLSDKEGNIFADGKLNIVGSNWAEYRLELKIERPKDHKEATKFKDAVLSIIPQGEGRVALDMVSLMPRDTYKGHGLRRDLVEAVAQLHPKFMRFPGGCLAHGNGLGNIYHWKESVGKLQDRKPSPNLWGYHQTKGLGFEEFFQLCDDLGCEPIPVVSAGVPCQFSAADSTGYAGQQGGIDMKDMPAYCNEILELIDWARRNHHLNYIGIGNEDLISTTFEERCLMICKAIKQRYPDIKIIGTAGPWHYPSSDNIEGWKFAKANKSFIDIVDEHYYESIGWFLTHPDYYDDYDRKGPKVYLGEYASRSRTVESALAEAAYLCNVERNGDVVEMCSYAPLFCNLKHQNWNPDLIYFDNDTYTVTPSYLTQQLFATHSGDRYVQCNLQLSPDDAQLKNRVAASFVIDSKKGSRYLKIVNTLPRELSVKVDGLQIPSNARMESFSGNPKDEKATIISGVVGNELKLKPYSVNVIVM